MYDVILPKRPTSDEWKQVRIPPHLQLTGCTIEAWLHKDGLYVWSAVEAPEAAKLGAEYHLSISKSICGVGGRCTLVEALWVCLEFGIPEAQEDNHIGGITRNFWRPVADTLAEYVCPCKAEEPAIVEDGGDYVWRPLTGKENHG